jgi:hypothetical protein
VAEIADLTLFRPTNHVVGCELQEVGAMRDAITMLELVPIGIVLSIAVITASAA